MPDRRGSRFVLEALFLVGLAVAVTLAKLDALEIAGVMLLGWLVVAILEWAAWRGEPHYGSGLPPRYYVPNVKLPPAQPLEQVRVGYPEAHRDEAPTWIASAALREEVLGEWPHATPLPVELPAEPEDEPHSPDAEPWAPVVLPAVLGEDSSPEPEPAAAGARQLEPDRDRNQYRRRRARPSFPDTASRATASIRWATRRRADGSAGAARTRRRLSTFRLAPEVHARFRVGRIGRSSVTSFG